MCGPRKYLVQGCVFFAIYALVDFLIFKNFDLGNWVLATLLYVGFTFLVDKLFRR